jgi:rubredoxin
VLAGLITLWRYRDLSEALVAQSKLDAEGFASFLADENVLRLNWFWSNGFGGVRLYVREDEKEAALAVLAEEIPEGFTADEVGEDYEQPSCPRCGSRDVSFETIRRGVALFALWALSLPVPIPVNSWNCENCGHEWKGEYV